MFRTQISSGFPHPLKTDSNELTGIGKNKNQEMMKPGFKKKININNDNWVHISYGSKKIKCSY